MSEPAARLLGVLERYVSSINARALLQRAIKANSLDASRLQNSELRVVVQTLGRSLPLFTVGGAQDRLMAELWGIAGGAPKAPRASQPVVDEADVGRARLLARSMCIELGVPSYTLQRITTCVSELTRNIVKYTARGGSVELRVESDPRRFVIVATDKGPGIPNLDEILSGGYRSKTGMGLGLLGTKRMVDRFEIDTNAAGTRVLVEVNL